MKEETVSILVPKGYEVAEVNKDLYDREVEMTMEERRNVISEILTEESSPPEDLPRTEPLSIRLTEDEMRTLNQMAVTRTQETGSPVTKSDVVREVMFGTGSAHIKALEDWGSFSSSRFEIMTEAAFEPILFQVEYLSVGCKVVASGLHFDRPKMRREALCGRMPRIGVVMMHENGEIEDSPIDIMKNSMVPTAGRMIMDHIDGTVFDLLKSDVCERDHANIDENNKNRSIEESYRFLKSKALLKIQRKGLFPCKMICGSEAFYYLVKRDEDFEEGTRRDVLMTGLQGHLGCMDVHISNQVDDGDMMILPQAEAIGNMDVMWHLEPFKGEFGFGIAVYSDIKMTGLKKDVGSLCCRLFG